LSHILIRTDQRGKDEALKMAEAARAKLARARTSRRWRGRLSEDKMVAIQWRPPLVDETRYDGSAFRAGGLRAQESRRPEPSPSCRPSVITSSAWRAARRRTCCRSTR
jgi:hypothetical protein